MMQSMMKIRDPCFENQNGDSSAPILPRVEHMFHQELIPQLPASLTTSEKFNTSCVVHMLESQF